MPAFRHLPHDPAAVRNGERLYGLLRELLREWIAENEKALEGYIAFHQQRPNPLTAGSIEDFQQRIRVLSYYLHRLEPKQNPAMGALRADDAAST